MFCTSFFVTFLCTLWFGYAHQPSAMQWSRSVEMKLPFGGAQGADFLYSLHPVRWLVSFRLLSVAEAPNIFMQKTEYSYNVGTVAILMYFRCDLTDVNRGEFPCFSVNIAICLKISTKNMCFYVVKHIFSA